MNQTPVLMCGKEARDARGFVRFVNDFDMHTVKRFYQVGNASLHQIRAFHGHLREAKYAYVTQGKVLFCAVPIDDPIAPSKTVTVSKFVLSAHDPSVLYVPPMFANGFMNLTKDATIMFFSTASLADSLADDYRFDAYYWGKDVWKTV